MPSFRGCLPKVVRLLDRLVRNVDVPADYLYYAMPSPWMQIKCMRILQRFPIADDPTAAGQLSSILQRILEQGAEPVKNVNKSNALQAVLVEAVGLVLPLERDRELVELTVVQLGRFISAREPNTRYLGLENMARLSTLPQVAAAVKRNLPQIVESLHDPDISIRRRALDLLYGMVDADNAQTVVQELLDYLVVSDFAIRDELVLKIAILAEKFPPSNRWYLDVVLTLIDKAGDYVSDAVWHRVVQIVTNDSSLQQYAAEQVLAKLQAGSAHETMVKVAGYLLGEFGHLLPVPRTVYFALLQQRFPGSSLQTKALLLSAYAKLLTHATDPAFASLVAAVFQRYHAFADVELQQRSMEYSALSLLHAGAAKEVLAEMPPFPQRENALLREVNVDNGEPTARATWALVPAEPATEKREAVPPTAPHAEVAAQPRRLDNLLLELGDDAPVAPVPQTRGVSDFLSLLSANADPAPPPPDSMSLDSFAANVRALSLPAAICLPPTTPPAVLYRKLVTADAGVLYEDASIQVGLKAEWRDATGSCILYVGNKSSFPLRDFGLRLQAVPGVRLELSQVPSQLAALQQVQVLLTVSCTAVFSASPSLTLSYVSGERQQSYAFTVPLPVLVTKFFTAAPAMDNSRLYDMWRAFARVEKVVSCAFTLEAWPSVFQSLRIHVLPGVDPNPLNTFACSSFLGALVIVRLESDARSPNRFRVTVAAQDALLAETINTTLADVCAV